MLCVPIRIGWFLEKLNRLVTSLKDNDSNPWQHMKVRVCLHFCFSFDSSFWWSCFHRDRLISEDKFWMLKWHNLPSADISIISNLHILSAFYSPSAKQRFSSPYFPVQNFQSLLQEDVGISLASSTAGARISQGGNISVTNICWQRNGVTTGEFALLDMSSDERADLTKSKVSGKSNRYSSFRRWLIISEQCQVVLLCRSSSAGCLPTPSASHSLQSILYIHILIKSPAPCLFASQC